MCVRAATVMDVPAGGLLEDRIDRAWFFAGRPPTAPSLPSPATHPQPPQQQPAQQARQLPGSRGGGGLPQQRLGVVVAVDEGSDSLETSSVVAESIGSRVRCR